MNKPLFKRLGQWGVTLVELMVVIVLIGILAAMAVPSFSGMMQRQRIEGAAEVLTAALHNAKAEAIKTNVLAGIVFYPNTIDTDLNTWCFGMKAVISGTTYSCNNCQDSPSGCAPGSVVISSDFTGVTARFNIATDRTFSPLRGTVTAGGAAIANPVTVTFAVGNDKLGVTANALGDIKICRPSGTTMGSYVDSGACP